MSARAPYPNAMVLLHPAMSAAQAEQVASDAGRDIVHDRESGNYSLQPFDHHDFRDTGNPMEKRHSPNDWRSWENWQPEKTPGVER